MPERRSPFSICIAQALSHDHFFDRSMLWAASYSMTRIICAMPRASLRSVTITSGIYDQRNRVQRSICAAKILNCPCRIRVKVCPNSMSELGRLMSRQRKCLTSLSANNYVAPIHSDRLIPMRQQRQGANTNPGLIATFAGIDGRSENNSGCSSITLRMYLGSMCLFTSKVDFRNPSRLSRSSALQSAR